MEQVAERVKFEIEFDLEQVWNLVLQFPPREKAELRHRLEEDWQRRFDHVMSRIKAKSPDVPEAEVFADVEAAILEVRQQRAGETLP